jgi:microcystin-dependent protein
MSTPFIGEVKIFGGNFAIAGWALCNGQVLQISQNTTLFSLIGNTYGGDGQTTFALPDLRSRVAMGQGNGTGLTPRAIGQTGGTETVTLTTQQMAQHTHMMVASGTTATSASPGPSFLCGVPTNSSGHFYVVDDGTQPPPTPFALTPASCGFAGGNFPHDNIMPILCMNYLIALNGIYPSRN